jgi:hypothetical protein
MNITSAGKMRENQKLQNTITLKIIGRRAKSFIFITYSSD